MRKPEYWEPQEVQEQYAEWIEQQVPKPQPEPLSPLAAAVAKARGDILTDEDMKANIDFLNKAAVSVRSLTREEFDLKYKAQPEERGRCWGAQFCPHPSEPCVDGCYYCGRDVGTLDGNHNHTEVAKGEYSCVCESC